MAGAPLGARRRGRAARTLGLLLGVVLGTAAIVPAAAAGDAGRVACPGTAAIARACVCWNDGDLLTMVCNPDGRGHPGALGSAPALTVPRQAAGATEERRGLLSGLPLPAAPPAGAPEEERRARLEQRQDALDARLLAIQRARFEARSRGDPGEAVERLDRMLIAVRTERALNLRQLRTLAPAEGP